MQVSLNGAQAEAVLEHYEKIIDSLVYPAEFSQDRCKAVFIKLRIILTLLQRTLKDDGPEARAAHAAMVTKAANEFISAFTAACSAWSQTVYCHLLQAHIPDMIKMHGSLGKHNMQSMEAMHQARKERATTGKGPNSKTDKDGNTELVVPNIARSQQTLVYERMRILSQMMAPQRGSRHERNRQTNLDQLEQAARELEDAFNEGCDAQALQAASNGAAEAWQEADALLASLSDDAADGQAAGHAADAQT